MKNLTKLLISLVLVVFFFALLRTAWVSDDAFITFRTIDNFVNGYGLVWNIGERVQTYTNPLWMLFLTVPYFFSHEIYFTVISISILLTLITVYWLLFKLQKDTAVSLVTGTILLSSQAFIDYSTSGLENVMTHFFIVIFVWTYFYYQPGNSKRIILLSFIASVSMVNRLDTILLLLPALLYELFKSFTWKKLGGLILGSLPVWLWEIFALVYYGFLFPNTYYAKLYTGIPLNQLIFQGFVYVLDSIKNDPITLFIIFASLIFASNAELRTRNADSKLDSKVQIKSGLLSSPLPVPNSAFRLPSYFWLCLGSLVYILYIIKNGGDFMSGRFFSAPFVLALASIQPLLSSIYSSFKKSMPFESSLIPATLVLFIISSVWHFSLPLSQEPSIPANGIVDERSFHFKSNGLVNLLRSDTIPPHPWAQFGVAQKKEAENVTDKRHVLVFPNVGMLGYFAGPKVYIIDPLGLVDPFLAHMPIDPNQNWRVGHYLRELPKGYKESKEQGKNLIEDTIHRQSYDDFNLIITSPLLSKERWQAIYAINFE